MNKKVKGNAISYSGKVKILYQDDKGKYRIIKAKNEGKLPLFTFLTYALQGIYAKELVPRYITGLYVDFNADQNNTTILKPAFTQKIILAKTPERKNSNNKNDKNTDVSDSVEYCFIINPGIFIKDANHTSITRLQLLNSLDGDNNVCAEIDLTDKNAIDTSSTSNIMIYWTLQFKNSDDVETY